MKQFMEEHYEKFEDMKLVKTIERDAKKEVFNDIENIRLPLYRNEFEKLRKKHLGEENV